MATLKNIQQFGNQLVAVFDDGTRRVAYPTSGGLWIVSGAPLPSGGGTVTSGGTVTGKAVIYPTNTTNVSDSFADHVARGSVNPGTDYTASYGSPVWAVADGTITDVTNTYSGSGGRMIHIDHTALTTGSDYLHLSDTLGAVVGTAVHQGDLIAYSGASGYGSLTYYGAHLHISYRKILGYPYQDMDNIDFDAYIKSL
jgi:murein DD-endopeptidase MepM/ murein hydrolase activator NlpD